MALWHHVSPAFRFWSVDESWRPGLPPMLGRRHSATSGRARVRRSRWPQKMGFGGEWQCCRKSALKPWGQCCVQWPPVPIRGIYPAGFISDWTGRQGTQLAAGGLMPWRRRGPFPFSTYTATQLWWSAAGLQTITGPTLTLHVRSDYCPAWQSLHVNIQTISAAHSFLLPYLPHLMVRSQTRH